METQNQYVSNLQSGKLNIFTTKEFYNQLADHQKKVLKNYCLWSSKQNCWISKAKTVNCHHLIQDLKAIGFNDGGSVGTKRSMEEQVKDAQQKAALRAENADLRATKAEEQSGLLINKAKEMASVIPFGQPILVGHHSEGRDRRYRGRINATFDKGFKEMDKAEHYHEQAEIARHTAEGKQYRNIPFLLRRIKESEKSIRILERRLLGKLYPHSPEKDISDQSRNYYNGRITEEKDKIAFYTKCFKEVSPDKSLEDYTAKTKKAKGQKP